MVDLIAMDPDQRRTLALELLERGGRVTVSELAVRTGVSEMTVRRDLEHLEREGCVRRVHGGAVSVVSLTYEPPFSARTRARQDSKRAIGRRAADLVDPGQAIVLDAGTTALEVARCLPGRGPLTVCTLGLQAAVLLTDVPDIRVIVPGGEPRKGEGMFTGELTQQALRDLRFDSYLMAVGGISAEGLTDYNLDDVAVKRAALASARRVIVVADAKKVGQMTFATISDVTSADVLVTDASAADDQLEPLREHGVEVLRA